MPAMKWYHTAMIAGGAVGVAGLLYYLMREEGSEATSKSETKAADKLDVSTATKEQVLAILEQVIQSQEKMKVVMKDLTKELMENDLSFDQIYQKVKAVQPADPLETTGLSMNEFDQLLDRFQFDSNVRDTIQKIMGGPAPLNFSAKVNSIRREQIVAIHAFMLKELKALVEQFQQLKKNADYDMKTVTIAAQAIVGAKIDKEFGVNSEEIESAVLIHHQALATDSEFARINVQMQSAMSDLLGSQFPATFF